MSEENEIDNNESNKKSQADLANDLNSILSQIAAKVDRIAQAAKTQSEFVNSIADSFSRINSFTEDMVENSNKMSEALNDTVEKIHENFSKKRFDDINEGLEEISKNAQSSVNNHNESLSEVGKSVKKTGAITEQVNKTYNRSSQKLTDSFKSNSKSLTNFYSSAKHTHQELETFTGELKETSEKMNDVASGYFGAIQKYVGTIMKGGMVLVNFVTSTIGTMLKFAKHALTLPFTIAKVASSMGFKLREMNAQIKEAGEDLKQSFDFDSSIGQGIQSLVNRGTGMLKSFLSPSNEMVRIFGMGVSGITGMIKFLGENIAAMGQFSEIFGESILKNDDKMKNFIRLVKGLGFSAEDIKYISLDASNNLKDVNMRMIEVTMTLSNTSKEFGVDRKRLSKNFMILRKDITQFGHLSDEEIARTTARLTQMRVKLEDAAAVFKKFSTFEDAANSVAMLSQTFGMNLDAMDIIKAKNPEDIIEMFRNSMLETGRSYQDLNRFEKDLMAQHTGISEQSLSALMNYRDLGLTYEQAKKKMESEQPEAKQLKAVKKLNSAIKELQKVLKFESPFEAFSKGIMNNMNLSGDLKNVMMSLSNGYEGIYKFALNLDPDTWSGLIRPIRMVIDIMRTILQSTGFKDGLVGTLTAVSGFVADIFGATQGDTILSKIETNVRMALGKGGHLYDNKTEKKKFNNVILAAVNKNRRNIDGIISHRDFEDLQKINDPLKLVRRLNKFKTGLSKNDPQYKKFDHMLEDVAVGIVGTYDPAKLKTPGKASDKLPNSKADPSKLLAASMSGVIDKNKDNVSELFGVSMKIAGAIIKGAITGGTAILMVINKQLKGFKESPKKPGESDNMLERILGFKPGEFNELANAINAAFKDFVSSLSSNSGIFTWLLGGIYDVFEVVARVFYSTFKGAVFELIGIENKQKTSQLMSQRSSKIARPNVSTTLENIKQNEAAGETQKGTDAVDILYAVAESAKTYKGKQAAALQNITKDLDARLRSDSLHTEEMSTFAENLSLIQTEMMKGNQANFSVLDNKINELQSALTEFDKNKKSSFDETAAGTKGIIDATQMPVTAAGLAYGAGRSVKKQYMKAVLNKKGAYLRGTSSVVKKIAGKKLAEKAGMMVATRALAGIGAGLAGVAGIAVAPAALAALGVGSALWTLWEVGSAIADYASSTDVKKLDDVYGKITSTGMRTIDSKIKENVMSKVKDLSLVETGLEKESNMIIAEHDAKEQFIKDLIVNKPQTRKLSREEFVAYMNTFENIKKEMETPLEIPVEKVKIDRETRQRWYHQSIKDGNWSSNCRTDLNIGWYAPSENGQVVNSSGADGMYNTSKKQGYFGQITTDN